MELREYQKPKHDQALKILKEHKIVYLAFETRTGKTFVSLSLCNEMGAKRVLFITKKIAINDIEGDYKASGFGFDIEIINYESLHKIEGEFDLVVCDEAHRLGSFPKPAQAVKQVKAFAKDKPMIFLSATPSPETHSQIFHQFHCSSFGPWGDVNFYKWVKEGYVNKTQKRISGVLINDYTRANEDLIAKDNKKFFVTLTQKESGFTFDIAERVLSVPMAKWCKDLFYKLLKDKFFHMYTVNGKKLVTGDTPVKLQRKCHQIATGSIITDDREYVIIDSSKAPAIKKDMEERGYKKAVIFYVYKSEEHMLKKCFGDRVTNNPQVFQESDDLVFISHVRSGREGIRLDSSHVLYMLNIDFSFLSYEQTRNRIQSFETSIQPEMVWVFSDLEMEKKIYKTVKGKTTYTSKYFKNDFVGIC